MIDIASRASNPPELIVGGFAVPLANDVHGFHERMLEVRRRRQQRAEPRVALERGETGVAVDLRHVDLPRGLSPTEPRECRVGVRLQSVGGADVVEHLRRFRLDDERAAIGGQRLVEVLGTLVGDAEQSPRAAVGRLACGQCFQDLHGAREVLRLQPCRGRGDGRFRPRLLRTGGGQRDHE